MSRLLAWISAVPGHFRGRMRSVGSAGFVAIAVVGLVVAMFLADGFRATTLDLENPGVWVTNGDKKLVGRFNTRAEEVDTVVQTDVSGLDVAQVTGPHQGQERRRLPGRPSGGDPRDHVLRRVHGARVGCRCVAPRQ